MSFLYLSLLVVILVQKKENLLPTIFLSERLKKKKEKTLKYSVFFRSRYCAFILARMAIPILKMEGNTKGDKKIEEIVLRRGTPEVVVFMPKSDRLGVCFDQMTTINTLCLECKKK